MDYHQLIDYMKELKAFFQKKYDDNFILGKIYKGSPDYSYVSITTPELKKNKLKYVIILNHKALNFMICLSGQNKIIRKKYWDYLNEQNLNKYHLVESINESLSIIDTTLSKAPDFNDSNLTQELEEGVLEFMNDVNEYLWQ